MSIGTVDNMNEGVNVAFQFPACLKEYPSGEHGAEMHVVFHVGFLVVVGWLWVCQVNLTSEVLGAGLGASHLGRATHASSSTNHP